MTTAIGELIPIATLASEDEADEAIQLMDQQNLVSTVETIGEIRAEDGSEPSRSIFMLKVAAEQAEVAREVLRAAGLLHKEGQGWHCTTCGTSVERSYSACWSCGSPREEAAYFEMPVVGSEGGSCGTGGCSSGGCGCAPSASLFDIVVPPEFADEVAENDKLANRAYVTAAVSLLLPPVVLVSTWFIGKALIRPLSSQGTKNFYAAIALSVASIIEASVLWNMYGAALTS